MLPVIRRTIPALAAAVFLSSLLAGPAAASVYISGRVTAGAAHTPVPDATVSLFKNGQSDVVQVAHTLQNGSFVLRAPSAGSYRLETEGSTLEPGEQAIEVPRSGLTALEISVVLIPVLHVRMLDPHQKPVTGEQVRGWIVVIADHTDGGGHTHQSQGLGFTKISSPEGVVDYAAPHGSSSAEATTVIIGARDATSGCAMLRFDKWPDTPVTLQLERGVTLSGSIVDKDGKLAAGAKVQVRPAMASTVPATAPAIIQLGEPPKSTTLRRLVTGPILPTVEEANTMQEGSPCFYEGSIRTTSDKDGHFEIPFLFSGCHVMVTFAVPGEGLKYQIVTLGGDRMELRLGSVDTLWLPAPCRSDVRPALQIPECY